MWSLSWVGGAAGMVVGSLLLLKSGARVRRRTGRTSTRERDRASLRTVVRDTIDDLRSEPDPRRAVIAAYARMEQDLGGCGMGRRAAEAPVEYLRRLVAQLDASTSSASRLTELFVRARFSPHVVDEAMREHAIDALRSVGRALEASR